MSKVFEALQRQLQNEKGREVNRDPLAEEIGTPDAPDGNGSDDETTMGLELPRIIGAPVGPRSNDGVMISSLNSPVDDPQSSHESHSSPKNGNIHSPHRPYPAHLGDRGEGSEIARPGKQELDHVLQIPYQLRVEQFVMTRLHPRLVVMTDPEAAECEQYRTLRTELFHASKDNRIQVVTVTSALVGEGKTSTVLNLALAIAHSKEKRVLVVDGDLRRPNIASYLAVRPASGLTEILKGESDLFEPIFLMDEPELFVLPVNLESSNPTELLSSERLGEMLEKLRQYFDFILIDSPPVMPFADSRLLATHSDSVILVVRAGLAPYETVEKAIEALPRGRILGVVLNGAEHLKEADYYNSYYSYARKEQRRRSFKEKIASKIRKSSIRSKMRL